MVLITWRSLSAAASFTPCLTFSICFLHLLVFPSTATCSAFPLSLFHPPFSFRRNHSSTTMCELNLCILNFPADAGNTTNTAELFSFLRGRGGAVYRWDAAPTCGVHVRSVYYKYKFCQHLSWSISEHSVSMSESYREWPVGSLSGDGGPCVV